MTFRFLLDNTLSLLRSVLVLWAGCSANDPEAPVRCVILLPKVAISDYICGKYITE